MTMKRVSEEVKMKELKQQGISILNVEIVNTVIGKPYLIDLFYAKNISIHQQDKVHKDSSKLQ